MCLKPQVLHIQEQFQRLKLHLDNYYIFCQLFKWWGTENFQNLHSSFPSFTLPSNYKTKWLFMESNGVLKGFNRSQTLANFATYFQYIILFESFLSLRNQYLALNLMPECRKWHFRASRFQNLLGEHASRTPQRGGALWPLKCYSRQLIETPAQYSKLCLR